MWQSVSHALSLVQHRSSFLDLEIGKCTMQYLRSGIGLFRVLDLKRKEQSAKGSGAAQGQLKQCRPISVPSPSKPKRATWRKPNNHRSWRIMLSAPMPACLMKLLQIKTSARRHLVCPDLRMYGSRHCVARRRTPCPLSPHLICLP